MKETPENTPKQAFEVSNMVFVKGGTFDMGDTFGDEYSSEKPVHSVTVADFYMAAFCVTFQEYIMYCFATGKDYPDDKGWGRGRLPVINVTWYDAVEYCNFLSLMHGLEPVYDIDKTRHYPNNKSAGRKWLVIPNWQATGYRLPTEAEWEYAARGGTKSKGYKYAGSNNIGEVAWYEGNSNGETHPIGEKKPNELGLYDLSGNVWEWCWDWFDSGYYAKSVGALNPSGAISGSFRVLRGGSWHDFPQSCRVACRNNYNPTFRIYGFRLVCVPQLHG